MKEVVLQRIIFPQEKDLKTESVLNSLDEKDDLSVIVNKTEQLYYRRGLPSTKKLMHDNFVFDFRQRVSFDTYYNSLSVAKWAHYTYADSNFSLKITLRGSCTVQLLHYYFEKRFGDNDADKIRYEVVATHNVNSEAFQTYKFPFEVSDISGCLAFSLQADIGAEFADACYVTDVQDAVNKVHLGIGICTFKREKYVLNNIANICKNVLDNSSSPLNDKLDVFISDNASTLPAEASTNSRVHVFQNKNTGGSGGFTRCMIEALRFNKENEDKITNLILMDDDVRFETESLERVFALLTLLKPQYGDAFIGGAMFTMYRPFIQHASGEYWHGERCENFIDTYNCNIDMSIVGNVLRNELETDANYQAWWFCTIPMSTITESNLSMPFFIKSDDIEYSVRNLKHLILLNGINVWHESFEFKYSAPNEYYTIRNYLITAAAHKVNISKIDILLLMRHYYRHYATNYKYLEIEHLCNAINDFLKGVDHFKSLDLAEVHQKIYKKGYKMVDSKDLPVEVSKNRYEHDIAVPLNWSRTKWKLAYLTANGLFLPARGYSVLGMWGGHYAQTYRKKFLVRYEVNSKKGFVLYRNRKEFFRVSAIYRKTKRALKRKFDKAYREFQKRWQELCTLENWNKQLGLFN